MVFALPPREVPASDDHRAERVDNAHDPDFVGTPLFDGLLRATSGSAG